jgi:arsenate reductase
MPEVTVYEKPTCTTCKKLAALLAERGIDYDAVEYHVLGLTLGEVRDIVAKTGERPAALLRRREPAYEELGVSQFEDDDERVIAAMVERPALLQRPVVIRGGRAVLARPVERALELL